ncbi:MAG: hypothetical protein LH461_09830 [Spirochaetaceae bacterium]|nr:hypothetical protein [Spirochaetaceae bacterium]
MRRTLTGLAVVAVATIGFIGPASAAGNDRSGPTVTNPDGSVRPGASPGDVNQEFGGGALQEFCRTVTG